MAKCAIDKGLNYCYECDDFVDINPVEESYSSDVLILIDKNNNKYVLKIPFNNEKVIRESEIIKTINNKLPVPEIIKADSEKGFLLLSYIEGKPIAGEISDQLAFDCGKLLAELHCIPMELFNDSHDNWWAFINERFYVWAEVCKKILDKNLFEKCVDYYENIKTNLPKPDGPCLTHFDYRPGNILVDKNKIVGLIDFESSRGGSADMDFVKMKLYMWDKFPSTKIFFLDGYLSVRKLPPINATLDLYEFYNAFGGIAWCHNRNKLEDPFFYENKEILKSIL